MIRRRKNIAILILTFVLGTAFPHTVQASFPAIKRLGGADRYDTCIKVAQDGWSSSYYAVIACGEDYPDALSSVPLAKKYDAPILLTYSNFMPANVMDEIKQLHVGKVFLIGGQGSISSSIEKQLQNQGIQTERLAGADRYETSVKIAEKFGKIESTEKYEKAEAITVATGEDYADALSIGPAAAAMGVPVLLVPKNYVPDATKKYIRNLNTIVNDSSTGSSSSSQTFKKHTIFVMGDSNVISDNVVNEFEGNYIERIEGKDKYYRNINAIARFMQKANSTSTNNKSDSDDNNKQAQYSVKGDMLSINNLYLASGEGFADALSGAALAAKTKSPIMLSGPSNSSLIKDFILSKIPNYSSNAVNPEYLTVLGGEGVMPGTKVSEIFGNIAFDNTIGSKKSDSDIIGFPDANFEKAIRDKLNIHDRNIYYSDVKGITSLDLSNEGISDITGLENFIHLKSLDLSYNEIKSLIPIVRLDELENLNLSHNKIEDVSYISNLVNLKELNLSDNYIYDLDNSRSMSKDLGETDYDKSSTNVFTKLTKLLSLDLSNSTLEGNYYRNRITDIDNLKVLTNLLSLNLNGNSTGSLDDLKYLTSLNTLKLSDTSISDLDFIKKLTNITYLDISNNSSIDSDDLSPLKNLTNLKYLNASNDKIDNVSSLSGLTHLTTLYIEDNPIKDYTPIIDITKSLYYKDFDVSSVVGGTSYDTDNTMNSQIKNEISSFQSQYGYGDYSTLRYRKLYHAYDLGTYNSQLQDLYRNRDWITYQISLGGMSQDNVDSLKSKLDGISYNVEQITKKDDMNKKVKDLEVELSAAYKPLEKEKLIGKINYVYSDYRYDYYRNLVQKYDNDIEKIKEQIQGSPYGTSNYSSNNYVKNLQYALDEIEKDRELASQKIKMYQDYKDFFNAVNAILEET